MSLIYSKFYDIPNDPFASTVDSVSEYRHVQSVSKGGTYLDVYADDALNYPVGTPTRLFVSLPERIDRSDLTGSRSIIITDQTIAANLTRVTGLPTGNEYRIPPESSVRRDIIEVSSTKLSRQFSYDYYGLGSVLNAEEYNNRHWVNNYTITADYAILDNDCYDRVDIAHSSTTKLVVVTLPTLADNIGRRIRVQNTGTGLTRIDGEGSEKISLLGNSLDSVFLVTEDDYIELVAETTDWKVEHYHFSVITGWINNSNWAVVRFGAAFTYDTKSAAVDLTGQHITEATSNQTALVLYDSGGTGNSGVLYVCSIAVGTGVWTNDRVVTCGSGGYTVAVNEGTGTSKNIDYDLYHGIGINPGQWEYHMHVNSSAAFAGAYDIPLFVDNAGGAVYGSQLVQTNTNSFGVYAYTQGLIVINTSFTGIAIDAEDWYRNQVVKISF